MKPITWEKRGLVIDPENGPPWRRHMSGAMHVMPLENERYRVYLTGVGEDTPTPLGEGKTRVRYEARIKLGRYPEFLVNNVMLSEVRFVLGDLRAALAAK